MLNAPQTQRMLRQLRRLLPTYEPKSFTPLAAVDLELAQTREELFAPPQTGYAPIAPGETWGQKEAFGWFRARIVPPADRKGQALYLLPRLGGAEGMIYVNQVPYGILTQQNGNHYAPCLTPCWDGEPLDVAVEMYTGHHVPGTQPLQNDPPPPETYVYQGAELCQKDEEVIGFVMDLRVLLELADSLPDTDYRRAQVLTCLTEVFRCTVASPDDAPEDQWRASLAQARRVMAPCLAVKNGPNAPTAGIMGHSHMDTAWLWPTRVTLKKCARTYSNQLALMDQYPEHRFFQSSAYHLEWMRRYYPALFERLSERIREGRYEPNGGVWIECDCNIPSGEAMVRQFLWGQRYTQKWFGYRSNTFWLPDTFGYNAAIPQIMKGCGIDYFVTTKMSWNDTTRFPWETFWWEGIDGTRVFTHFSNVVTWPSPQELISRFVPEDGPLTVKEKRVTDHRLLPYGFGDGGGGPMFEMLETARRCADLAGCPKVEFVNAGDFLREMEATAVEPPVHRGELYLELHRGTLTNQHTIKRNNRKAEVALHGLELAEVLTAVREGRPASQEAIDPLWETLLVNQFHDILPGTCIQPAHEQAEREVAQVIARAGEQTRQLLAGEDRAGVTLLNPLGFEREDTQYLPAELLPRAEGAVYQATETVEGAPCWAVDGLRLEGFAARAYLVETAPVSAGESPFRYDGRTLETPFATLTFGENGGIESFFDKRLGRELRARDGLPLNTFLVGEDLPADWDNWDVDADLQLKLAPAGALTERRVISDGAVEFRLRSVYRLTEKTTVTQDLVCRARSPRIDFETLVDWHDRHRFWKAAFDLDLRADFARNEIQFGHVLRPTTRNTEREQAMFEVCNHRWTDLSELDQGAAVLNDCKYGVTVEGGSIRLSLHKGGCRPDDRGDAGLHRFTYSLFPHAEGFSAAVIREGELLNLPVIAGVGSRVLEPLCSVNRENIVLDTVKPCQDTGRAFILRLYEAAGVHTRATLKAACALGFQGCNLLEEPVGEPLSGKETVLDFTPFEVKTVKISY